MENSENTLEKSLMSAETERALRSEVNEKIDDLINYCLQELKMTRDEAYLSVEDMLMRSMKQRKDMVEAQAERP